eukprot:TRINITY_DN10304_c0_g1_i1.p1 TRINITY_DN10304_c0_g1~~TRINITY_DN10304_c0_g1_i1.p1  ORF type:complete len:154 (+),score=17.94 TRINITY_DN10304_c0_g1_i1:239-700(+)
MNKSHSYQNTNCLNIRKQKVLAMNILKSFKKGAVGSLTALYPQHVLGVLDVPLYTSIITLLASFLNMMVGRLVWEVIRPLLVGTKSFALFKNKMDSREISTVCPVANGNFEKKWVSGYLTNRWDWTVKDPTSECIGIGVLCSIELVVYTIKKC